MKNSNFFLRVVFTTLILQTAGTILAQDTTGKAISPESFEQKMKKRRTVVLDVRTAAEYNEGHIPGAININVLDTTLFPLWIKGQNRKTKYLLYCRSSKRSGKALMMMEEAGYKHLLHLEGGITAWKGALTQGQQ